MPKPVRQINIAQFQELVRSFDWQRQITEVHMHHTWQPNHSQYQGLASIEGMWDFHVNTNKWSDIAQHISIAPDGTIWTGRGWNTPPASSSGHNGSAASGPFMFETIGNFDTGRDPFGGDQKATVIAVIAALLDQFGLPVSELKFHNQLGSPKTCPGSSIDYTSFCAEVEAHRATGSRSRSTRTRGSALSATEKRAVSELKKTLATKSRSWKNDVGASCCEEHSATSRGGADSSWSAADRENLARHVINLRNGQFIASGDYTTSADDVRRLFEVHLAKAQAEAQANNRPLRVLFWAHGGLCGEKETLQHVLDYHQGWLSVGVYPIYFIWETDHATALHDIFLGGPASEATRGWITDITDAGLEFTLQGLGRGLWRQIKEYAANAVKKPAGGALFAAQQLAAFMKSATTPVELYAMGHSAGSIFHSWFLPTALACGVKKFNDLFLLAPAITVADFKDRLLLHIGPQSGIAHCSMFTMTEKAEREDNVITIYRKSLLYFVSRACEEADETPILGLQEDIYKDADLRHLFGVDATGAAPAGDVQWSPNGQTSNSITHGGFDNDPATLHTMVKRMTGSTATPFSNINTRKMTAEGTGRKVALCIGIDKYARKPLSGCVNDARQWKSALEALGFETRFIADEQATYDGIVGSLRTLISGSRPGDQLVFQYAGHGTHVDDVNGDEALEDKSDTRDEALVPFDFTTGKFLIDDDIGDIMDSLPAGVSLTCFMDCCHSGTNTRAFGFGDTSTSAQGETSRYLPVPAEIMIQHVAFRRSLPIKPVRRSYAGKPEVLFAACSPKQEAKESGGHGYFTITAVPMLAQGAGRLTHAQFIAAVQKAFPDHVEDQDPQLDCSQEHLGALLFGAAATREAAVVIVPPAVNVEPTDRFDVATLNETMNLYLKLLNRLL